MTTKVNDTVTLKTYDRFDGIKVTVDQIHEDAAITVYIEGEDDDMTFEASEYYNPETHAVKTLWADGHEVKVLEYIGAVTTTEDKPVVRRDGWCNECESYCYEDCQS